MPPALPRLLLTLSVLLGPAAGAEEACRLELDLGTLGGAPGLIAPLRSSSFFVPKTKGGFDSYLAAPASHRATRISLFEQALAASQDEASFLANLERHRAPLTRLCQVTERLVIVISKMPAWLSRLPGATAPLGAGDWTLLNAQPPRDLAVWRRVVAAGVRWFAAFPGARRDFEVWNEPDLGYWKGTPAEFLRLYEETALAIRAADPQARIGGAGLNAWQGGDSDLNMQLIRLAGGRKVPLDFVSWHWFSPDPAELTSAATAYAQAARNAGLAPLPAMQVTEWNLPDGLRGTAWAAAMHAEAYLAFLAAGLDAQMVATWEDFDPRPAGLGDYGLLTQQGIRKPEWHLQRFVDTLAREAAGWAVSRPGSVRLLASRGVAGHRLLCWDPLPEPRLAALAVLRRTLSLGALAATYGDTAGVLAWVERGRSKDGLQDRLFAEARAASLAAAGAAGGSRRYVLRLVGLPAPATCRATAVKTRLRTVPLQRQGEELAFSLERNEVMLLEAGD